MLILALPGRHSLEDLDGVFPLVACGDLGETVRKFRFADGDSLPAWYGENVPSLLDWGNSV